MDYDQIWNSQTSWYGSLQLRPHFATRVGNVAFVVDKVTLGQFSVCVFLCRFSYQNSIPIHLPSNGWTIRMHPVKPPVSNSRHLMRECLNSGHQLAWPTNVVYTMAPSICGFSVGYVLLGTILSARVLK